MSTPNRYEPAGLLARLRDEMGLRAGIPHHPQWRTAEGDDPDFLWIFDGHRAVRGATLPVIRIERARVECIKIAIVRVAVPEGVDLRWDRQCAGRFL